MKSARIPILSVLAESNTLQVISAVPPPFNPSGMSPLEGRPVVRSPEQLRLHRALHELGWTAVVDELNDAARLKNQSLPEPILITTKATILAGFGRWRLATLEGCQSINSIEYPLSEGESLQFILIHHQLGRGWNAFIRIRVALTLEAHLRQRALDNMRAASTNDRPHRAGSVGRSASSKGVEAAIKNRDPLKQILLQTHSHWDKDETRLAVRQAFRKTMQCRTATLGAEVYASQNQERIVYHPCKSRACTSCGYRATVQWQRERWAALPDRAYKGITFTMSVGVLTAKAPCLSDSPLPFHGPWRDAKQWSNLFDCHPCKVAQLDDPTLLWIKLCKTSKGCIQLHQLICPFP